jgi:hypothetical protein
MSDTRGKVKAEPVSEAVALGAEASKSSSFKNSEFRVVYDPSEDFGRQVDTNAVEHNGFWALRWSDPRFVMHRKEMYGYQVVTPDCVVVHRDALEKYEFRIMGAHRLDGTNNVIRNASEQILIALPLDIHRTNQRLKLEKSTSEMQKTLLGDPSKEMPRLMDNKAALRAIEEGTYYQHDNKWTATV